MDRFADQHVVDALAEMCNLPPADITPEMKVQDLGLDSWTMTAVVARLETQWQCEFSTDQIVDLLQADEVRGFIERIRKMAEAPASALPDPA